VNNTYLNFLQKLNPREVHYTIALSFDFANTDILYLTSSADAKVPDGATVIQRNLKINGGTSQKVNTRNGDSSIGNYSFEVADLDKQLTNKLYEKEQAGKGIRHKRCIVYKGFNDMDFIDYEPEVDYIVDNVEQHQYVYTFELNDRQREARKNIFTQAKTTLTKTMTAEQMHIPVTAQSLSGFGVLEHDANYTDDPSITVRYIKIDKEVIACNENNAYTHPTDGLSFVVIRRGAFGTIPAGHESDEAKPIDKRTEVTEYVYLEGAVLKIAYAVLTGVLYGQTGTMPTSWNLGISTDYVVINDFLSHPDLWNPATGSGKVVLFEGYSEIEGKEFLRKEILPWVSGFLQVGNDGRIGFKRLQPILRNANYVAELNNDNVISYNKMDLSLKEVVNIFRILWQYDPHTEQFLQKSIVVDFNSISKHNINNEIEFEFKGLRTGKHTQEDIINYFESYRDHFSNPPYTASLKCLPSTGWLQVGQTVKVKTDKYRDKETNLDINRVFEIHGKRIDKNGDVTFDLFASTGVVTPLPRSINSAVLNDSFYTVGVDLSTVLTISGGVITADGDIPGGRYMTDYYYNGDLTLPSNRVVTFNKNTRLRIKGFFTRNGILDGKGRGFPGGSESKTVYSEIWYGIKKNTVSNDISITGASGNTATINWTGNTLDSLLTNSPTFYMSGWANSANNSLWIVKDWVAGGSDAWKNNVDVLSNTALCQLVSGTPVNESAGANITISGSAGAGVKGFFGGTKSGKGLVLNTWSWSNVTYGVIDSYYSNNVQSDISSLPFFEIRNQSTSIDFLPNDLIGTSGSAGGNIERSHTTSGVINQAELISFGSSNVTLLAKGGDGGNSGAGLTIICRGMSFGPSGYIDTSGDDGQLGEYADVASPAMMAGRYYAGAGAGGSPGGLAIFLDGNHVPPSISSANHKANRGNSPFQANAVIDESTKYVPFLGGSALEPVSAPQGRMGFELGYEGVDLLNSARRIQYVPPVFSAEPIQTVTVYKLKPLTSLTLVSGASTLLIRGDNSVDERVKVTHIKSPDSQAIGYEIQAKKTSASVWRSLAFSNDVDDTEHFISVDEGESYDFRGRVLADATAKNSDWTATQTHVAVGVSDLGAMATPSGVVADSGTAQLISQNDGTIIERILLTWNLTNDPLWTGTVIEYKKSTDTNYQAEVIQSSIVNRIYITGIGGITYNIRLKHLSRTKPDSAYFQLEHLLTGKTQPPSSVPWFDIEGKTFTFGHVNDLDLKGYQIRFHYGNVTTYEDATPLHEGYITSSPHTVLNLPTGSGQITYLINSFDTGDRIGLTPAAILSNLGDPLIENLVETQDEKAGGFTGTKVNGTVSGGNLVASSSTQHYPDNSHSQVYPNTSSAQFYADQVYYEMSYTFSFSPSVDSFMVLNFTVTAEEYKVEYKLSTNPDYITWPGRVYGLSANTYNFKVTTSSGTVQGVISALSVDADLPDISEDIQDFVVASTGTVRLPITKTYTAIKTVTYGIQQDGNGANNVRTLDKNPTLGPSVQTLNVGTRVQGLIDATIKGY